MKNTLRKRNALLIAAAMALAGLSLQSCYDDGWYPKPPYGWYDTFYDGRLTGYWQLDEVNSQPVGPANVDYLYFNGDGRGIYYYWDRGVKYWENTAYWCQQSNGAGASAYQINLQYQTSGSPTTMNYWFTNGNRELWMQWRNAYGVQTYIYRPIPGPPW